jgi:hypothetical protein
MRNTMKGRRTTARFQTSRRFCLLHFHKNKMDCLFHKASEKEQSTGAAADKTVLCENKGTVCFVWFVDTSPTPVQNFQVRVFHLVLKTFKNFVSTRFEISIETSFVNFTSKQCFFRWRWFRAVLESSQSLVRKGGLFARVLSFGGISPKYDNFSVKVRHHISNWSRATQFRPKTNVRNFVLQNTLYPSQRRLWPAGFAVL